MARTLLLVGTRKGLFTLESDEATARLVGARAVLRELARLPRRPRPEVRRRSTPPPRASGSGQAVWRSKDLGETWEHSSEGIGYGDDSERKVSKVSSLAVADGRVLVGVEAPGIFASDDGGETWSLLTTLAGQPGSEGWDDPANQPPGHLGISAIMSDPDDAEHVWTIVQGIGAFESDERRHRVDAAQQGPARRLAARARGGRLLRPPARPLARRPDSHVPAEPRRHAPQRRRRPDLDGDHRRPADGVRVRGGRASAGPRHVLRDPARPGPRPHDAGGQGGGLAHARRRRELAAARQRAAAERRVPRRAARGDDGRRLRRARASTSGRAPARSSRAPTTATAGARSRATCRRSGRSRWRSSSSHGRSVPADGADVALRRPAAERAGRRARRWTRRSTSSTDAGRACATGSAKRARRCGGTSTSTWIASERPSTRRSRTART